MIGNAAFVKIILLILFLSLIIFTGSGEDFFRISGLDKHADMGKYIGILDDSSKNLSPRDVIGRDFVSFEDRGNLSSKSRGKKIFWLNLKILNDTGSPVELVLWEKAISRNQVLRYYQVDGEVISPLSPLTENLSKYTFRIFLEPGAETTILARYAFHSWTYELYLMEPTSFKSEGGASELVVGLLLGIFLVMVVYNLFLFFSIRNLSYLYYVFFVFFVGFFMLFTTGTIYRFFPQFSFNLLLFENVRHLMIIFLGLFSASFLMAKRNISRINRLIFDGSLLFLALFRFIDNFRGNEAADEFNSIYGLIYIVILIYIIVMIVQGWRRKSKPAFYYTYAAIPFLLSIVLLTLMQVGVFPAVVNTAISHFYMTGQLMYWTMAFMILVFSLSLADRINQFRKEKELAQEEAILSLRKADKLKDEFLANTSHELRTPLHGIIGIAESLIEGVTGPLSPDTIQNLYIISGSGRRLFNMVNDILDYSKLRNNELALQFEPVSLAAVTDHVILVVKQLIGKKNLKIESRIPSNFSPVLADQNRLQQILYNLIGNAVKFTHEGTVEVSASLLNNQVVAVQIRDTGIGIRQEDLGKIFNSFEQVDGTDSRSYGGTGLGLSITKKLVEIHMGTLSVESVPGEGSCFTFTLRTAEGKPQVTGETTEPPAVFRQSSFIEAGGVPAKKREGSYKVLVVDDDPVNIQIVRNQLSFGNYVLVGAESGMEALQILDGDEEIDLVLLDIMMPQLSGYDVCREIRQKFSLYQKPVLMLTAKNQAQDVVMGFDAGANDYLTKPFERSELVSRVKTLLNLKRLTESNRILKDTNDLKNRIMGIVAHDLRNPLTLIIGYAYKLKTSIPPDETVAGYIQSINKASNKMLTLVSEILESSRIEDGNLSLERAPLDFVALIHDVRENFKQIFKAKDQAFVFEPSVRGIFTTAVDRKFVVEILDNLISNASKYSPRGSSVEVVLRNDVENRTLCVDVKDQGPGLLEEDKKKIFGKFQTLSAKPTDSESSLGLGLYIARELAIVQDGDITFSSEPGKGAIFTLELPIR